MSDARAESRRRLAEVLVQHQRLDGGPCLCGWFELGRLHSVHVADAVLELFPDVEWAHLWQGAGLMVPAETPRAKHRRLVLASALEPVVPEEPQP